MTRVIFNLYKIIFFKAQVTTFNKIFKKSKLGKEQLSKQQTAADPLLCHWHISYACLSTSHVRWSKESQLDLLPTRIVEYSSNPPLCPQPKDPCHSTCPLKKVWRRRRPILSSAITPRAVRETFSMKHPKRVWHVVSFLWHCCVLLPKNSIVSTKYIAMWTGAEKFQLLAAIVFHLTN